MLVRVLILSRDRALQERLVRASEMPYVLVSAHAGEERARRLVEESYDIAVLDEVADAEALREQLARRPERPSLVIVGPLPGPAPHGSAEFTVLDPDLPEPELVEAMHGLVNARRLLGQPLPPPVADPRPDIFVAASEPMRTLLEMVRRVAPSTSSVLLRGETGSGKEKIASLIHRQSRRRGAPFVAINCAAIPHELFESELFGHRRGAFTGANRDHRGVFEQARGGTLFLDEIGDLPLSLQPKLLRVLQEHQVRPVGSDAVIEVDVRLVAATNRDLKADADAGRFRSDLYYRLAVVELFVPPLRERRPDVWPLAEAWLAHFSVWMGRTSQSLDPALRPVLESYPWPGNVRELINVMERAALLGASETVELSDLPPEFAAAPVPAPGPESPAPSAAPAPIPAGAANTGVELTLPEGVESRPWRVVRDELLATAERHYLDAVLTATRGRIAEVARRAGMTERAVFEKMRRHALRKEDYR